MAMYIFLFVTTYFFYVNAYENICEPANVNYSVRITLQDSTGNEVYGENAPYVDQMSVSLAREKIYVPKSIQFGAPYLKIQ